VSGGGPLPYLCIAGSGSRLLLISLACDVYVWEIDRGQSLFTAVKDSSHVTGTWTRVDKSSQSAALAAVGRELAIHTVFTSNPSVCFLLSVHFYPPCVSMEGYIGCCVFSLSGYRYLGDSGTNRCEMLHDGTYRSQSDLLPFGAVHFQDPQI